MPRVAVVSAVVGALLTCSLVTGCAAEPAAAPTSTGAATETSAAVPTGQATPDAEATEVAPAVSVPPCAELLTADVLKKFFGEGIAAASDTAPPNLPGAVAQAAIDTDPAPHTCRWTYASSDGELMVAVSTPAVAEREALLEALGEASSYRAADVEGATAFTSTLILASGNTGVAYVFVGDTWIIAQGTIVNGTWALAVAEEVLASLRAANPGL